MNTASILTFLNRKKRPRITFLLIISVSDYSCTIAQVPVTICMWPSIDVWAWKKSTSLTKCTCMNRACGIMCLRADQYACVRVCTCVSAEEITISMWLWLNFPFTVLKVHRNLLLAGCLPRQAGAKLFENQSVFGSQITIRSLVSPRSLLLDRQLASQAWGGEQKKKREKKERGWWFGHPAMQPAGVGSTPTKSSRHLLGACKVQHTAKNRWTSQGIASCPDKKWKICPVQKDNYISYHTAITSPGLIDFYGS